MVQRGKWLCFIKRIGAAFMGTLAGSINLLFGGGGGILAVPSLQKVMNLEERYAHASAVAVMFPLSLISFLLASLHGTGEMKIALPVCIGALLGGGVGGMLLKRIPTTLLSVLFYAMMIYVGIRYLK